jgi:hypothetical protein
VPPAGVVTTGVEEPDAVDEEPVAFGVVVVVFGVVAVFAVVVVVGFLLQGWAFVLFWPVLQYGIFFGGVFVVGAALAPSVTPTVASASRSSSAESRRVSRFRK